MARIAVQRFDPSVDQQARWASYDVALAPHQTVLDALLAIADTIDPTLAFRRTCRSGICGGCAGVANGAPVLFCEARFDDLRSRRSAPPDVEADIVVQPLARFRVLKDLVTDMEPFFESLTRVHAWLVPNAAFQGLMSKHDVQRLWGAAQCILCGICASQMPPGATGEHPAAVAHTLRFARDPRDAQREARLALLEQPDQYDDRFAEALKTVCPKHVDVGPLLGD